MASSTNEAPEDAGDAPPAGDVSKTAVPPSSRNACLNPILNPHSQHLLFLELTFYRTVTALMTPKACVPVPPPPRKPAFSNPHDPRDGLYAYMQNPANFPSSRVIYHNENFVAINDAYPKATVHTLLLPRNESKTLLHPFDALSDPEFLTTVRAEAEALKVLVASELRHLLGKHSASEQARIEAMSADPPPDTLPLGRDWTKEIRVGVHAGPSMNHLHVHVMSRDMHSECLKHRKHYNSFNTPFFVPLDDFPLKEEDERWGWGRMHYMKRGFVCWKCGAEFGNRFQLLKGHLEEEFSRWRAE